jgi:AraC-like DNA-binding protein
MLFVGYFLDPDYKFKKWYWIHTIPFILSIILIGFAYYKLGKAFTDLYLYKRGLFLEKYNFTYHIVFIHNIVYLIFGFLTIIKKYVNQESPNWVKDKNKLLWILYGLTLILLGHMYIPNIYYLTNFEFINYIFLVQFPLLIFLFYSIFRFPYFLDSDFEPVNEETHNNVEVDLLKEKIKEIMEKQKPHLNPDLTIKFLADLARIPSYQISELLNKYLDKNFNEFVNYYRVEEAKIQLLSEGSRQYSVEGIGKNCGFKSKFTFYTTFKKLIDLTPSEFKKIKSSK